MRTLIVGNGFSGRLHAKAWQLLSAEVYTYDPYTQADFRSMEEALRTDPDVVDFCDTPYSRIRYLQRFKEELEGREIYLEKPPVPPLCVDIYENLCADLDITPVHNYLFMNIPYPYEVVILRTQPHKWWYAVPSYSGGGILLDHGYHWLYLIYDRIKPHEVSVWIDGFPDYTVAISHISFSLFATWQAKRRITYINGIVTELRTEKNLVESFKSLFSASRQEKSKMRAVSIEILRKIENVYTQFR